MEYLNSIDMIFADHIETIQDTLSISKDISEVSGILVNALRKGKKILFCGNGGSAADAQHLAAEFTGKFLIDRTAMPAMALTTNTSVLTAIGNDYSFEDVFMRQTEAFVQENDIFFALSTSGNSKNVISAANMATKKGAITIGLTGSSGGLMMDSFDICLRVPSDHTPRIQEAHILIGHIICEIVERQVFLSKQ